MAYAFTRASSMYLEKDVAVISGVPFTMACWFRSDDVTNLQNLIGIEDKDDPTEYFALQLAGSISGDPVRAITRGDAAEDRATTSTGYSVNTWHHAAAVFTSASSRFAFIDGGSKGTQSDTNNVVNLDRISIGRLGDSSPSNYMSGRIAEVCVWDAALSDQEILALASGILPWGIRPQNLQAYYPLWGEHTTAIDLSNNGNSLTLFNTPVKADHAPVLMTYNATFPLIETATGGRIMSSLAYSGGLVGTGGIAGAGGGLAG